MQAFRITFTALGFLLLAGCATTPLQEFGQLEETNDETKLYVSFSAEGADYRRMFSEINRAAIGWIEAGNWRAEVDGGFAEVRVYIATLYDGKAFQKKSIREIRTLARDFSRLSAPEFGARGKINTESGPVEYIFLRSDSRACVFIRKYWSDPELRSDIIQLTGTFHWISGQSMIYASDCRPDKESLQLTDLKRLFDGIKAKNLHWPDTMFKGSDLSL